MATLAIQMPEEMKARVEKQSAERGYASVSEFFHDLFLAFQDYVPDEEMLAHLNKPEIKKRLEAKLLEGYNSPKVTVDKSFWEERQRQRRERFPDVDFDIDAGR